MRRNPTKFRQFFDWMRQTLDFLCERPDHLQRLSIVGAGMSLYPAVVALTIVMIWFGVSYPGVPAQIVGGLFNVIYFTLALFALVIVSMLGTIKGLKLGPRGLELSTTFDDLDVDAKTKRDTRLGGGGRSESFGGYGGYDGEEPRYDGPTDLPDVDGPMTGADEPIPTEKTPGRITD